LISYLLYAADGNTIEYVANHEGEAAPIIPDTLGDVFERTMCDLVRLKQDEQRRHAEESRKVEPGPVKTPEAKPTPQKSLDPTPEKSIATPSGVDTALKPADAESRKPAVSTPPLAP
jgi:hypothetical protein